MRQFARPFPIERLSLEARVLYTGFLAFLLAGLVSSVWLYRDSFGDLSGASAVAYYRGSDVPRPTGEAAEPTPRSAVSQQGPSLELPSVDAPAPPPTERVGGPALELPPAGTDVAAAPATEPRGALRLEKPARQVMETFHFHLFTVPVVLLIVGHLFMLTALATRWKVAWLSLASLATFAHLLAPLAVRFGGAHWGPLMPATVVLAALGWTPLTVWPLWEMWRPRDGTDAP